MNEISHPLHAHSSHLIQGPFFAHKLRSAFAKSGTDPTLLAAFRVGQIDLILANTYYQGARLTDQTLAANSQRVGHRRQMICAEAPIELDSVARELGSAS